MPTVMRKLEFDAGHRILKHESKCKHLHGHRYVAEVYVTSPDLDPLGRVIDFSVLKQKIGGWIDTHWDHNVILNHQDPLLRCTDLTWEKPPYVITPSIVGGSCNPTAEVMAEILFDEASKLLPEYIRVWKVVLWETPNCCAVCYSRRSEHVLERPTD